MRNAIYVFIIAIITWAAFWIASVSLMLAYIVGLVEGIVLLLVVVKAMGKRAKSSLICEAVFRKITSYKSAVYNIERRPYNISVTVNNGDDDHKSLLSILTGQLQFKDDIAKAAAKKAEEVCQGKPLEEKIREALKYIDKGENP